MKKKVILSSVLTIVLCLSLIVGASFALFTSESKVNVAINSGTVDVDAIILKDSLKTYSLGVEQPTGKFENGGTALFTDEITTVLNLTNITPGDEAKFQIQMENKSNVTIQYRVKWGVDGELYEALKATADAGEGAMELENKTTEWIKWEIPQTPEEKIKTIDISVLLPTATDNDYQNNSASIAFTVEAIQGNAVVENVGTADQLFAAVKVGGTVTLTDDITITETLTVGEGTSLAIDLAGNNIICENGAAIENYGDLVITDNSVSTLAVGDETVEETNTIKSATTYAVNNCGTMTINGGKFIGLGGINSYNSTLIINGGEFYASGRYDGTPVSWCHTLRAENSNVTINGGVFDTTVCGGNNAMIQVASGSTITINGGSFITANVEEALPAFPVYIAGYENTGKLVINGGNFFGGWRFNNTATTDIFGGTFAINSNQDDATHDLSIYGGTFNNDFITTKSACIDEYHEATANDNGTSTVAPKEGVTVIKTSDNLAALSAKSMTGTIVFLSDIDMSDAEAFSAIVAPRSGSLTVVGNGHTISNVNIVSGDNDNGTNQASMFYCYEGSTLTVSDLVLSNLTVTTPDNQNNGYAAAVVGYAQGNAILNNVDVYDTKITGTKSSGTLVGQAQYGSLVAINCDVKDSSVTISKADCEPDGHYAGKLVGTIAEEVTLTNCTYENVTVSGSLIAKNEGEIYGRWVSGKFNGISFVSNGLGKDDSGNYYVYNANGLSSLKAWMDQKSQGREFWNISYNIMDDIDATGVTWNTIWLQPGSSAFVGFTFNGNGHTISNLTINGQGLFSAATKGATFKDITFDNVNVSGATHHTGVVWGAVYGDLTLDNVNVINSTVIGGCNVGGLVGRNDDGHAVITFKNCSVKNTTITATTVADFCGASEFLGMALKTGAATIDLRFEGTNVAEGNTLTSANGLTGGGIYATSNYGEATWEAPVVINDFNNYSNEG